MALTVARMNAAIDAALATSTYAQLHTGDPGAAGTSNVAAGVSRVAVSFPASNAKSTNADVSFTIPGAGGPYTHVSLWTAVNAGTYNGMGACSTQESFAGAGILKVSIVVSDPS